MSERSEHGNPKRHKRVAQALANPAFFAEYYFRPFDPNWNTEIPNFGKEMLTFAMETRRGVVILPPEFAKSTLISQVFPLWLTVRATVRGELLRGMLLSEEEGMAIQNLGVIAWHIENNEYLHRDFSDSEGRPLLYPDQNERTWREDAIKVTRPGTSKDPTWVAKGLDSKGIQGRRLDWLIGDDVITPANAFSPAMRKKAIRDWNLQITTRLVNDGRALLLGNFNDPHDLVSTLSSARGYVTFKRPAIHKRGQPDVAADIGDADAEPLWPTVWPIARLQQEKEDKPNYFQRVFLLNASSEMGERLRVDWVSVIRPADAEVQTPLNYCKFVMALDPAPGGTGDDLDFFNITIGALHDRALDVIVSFDTRTSVPRQVELIGLFHDRYQRIGHGVIAIGGAKVALDRYLRGAILIARPDLEAKIREVSIPGSKEERLEALGPYAQTGWLRVHEEAWTDYTSDVEDRWQELTLYEQWRDFPDITHDDKLDGCDVLVRTARDCAIIADTEVELEMSETW